MLESQAYVYLLFLEYPPIEPSFSEKKLIIVCETMPYHNQVCFYSPYPDKRYMKSRVSTKTKNIVLDSHNLSRVVLGHNQAPTIFSEQSEQ